MSARVAQHPGAQREKRFAAPALVGRGLTARRVERVPSGLSATLVDAAKRSQVQPLVPRGYVTLLAQLATIEPSFAHAVRTLIAAANTGHELVVEGAEDVSDAVISEAEAAVNGFARRALPGGGGLDGLISHLMRQEIVSGAVSAEAVLSADRRGVARVAFVPVEDVEFRWAGDEVGWQAVQRVAGGLAPLDPRTHRYLALWTYGGNPYAIPPFTPAINPILRKLDMNAQTNALIEKLGWLGFMEVVVKAGAIDQRPDEDDAEYEARVQAKLDRLFADFSGDLADGFTIHTEEIEAKVTPAATANAAGARDLLELVELDLFAGLGLDPALFGRTFSTTETYAGVVNHLKDQQAGALRRDAGAFLEHCFRLQLSLSGLPVSAYPEWAPFVSLSPAQDAQAEQSRWQRALSQVSAGLVSPDEAARQLGYDSWFDLERVPRSAGSGFDLRSQWEVMKDMASLGALSPDAAAERLELPGGWFDQSRIPDPTLQADPFGGLLGPDRAPPPSPAEEPDSGPPAGDASEQPGIPSRRRHHRFRFDAPSNRYRFRHPTVPIRQRRRSAPASAPRPAHDAEALVAYGSVEDVARYIVGISGDLNLVRMVERFLRRYAGRAFPRFAQVQHFMLEDLRLAMLAAPADVRADPDRATQYAMREMSRAFRRRWSQFGGDDYIDDIAATHEEQWADWRTQDTDMWRGDPPPGLEELDSRDLDASRALARGDNFHMSLYLDDMGGDERKRLETLVRQQIVELGETIEDPDVMDEFLSRLERSGDLVLRRRDHGREGGFASETEDDAWRRMSHRVRRIAVTSTMRARNISAINGMDSGGFSEMEFVAELDARTSSVCRALHGTRLPVRRAAEHVQWFHSLSALDQERQLRVLSPEEAQRAAASGQLTGVVPPVHPHCRSRVRPVLEA